MQWARWMVPYWTVSKFPRIRSRPLSDIHNHWEGNSSLSVSISNNWSYYNIYPSIIFIHVHEYCCCVILQNHGCPGWVFVDDCSHHNVYTAIFFGIHSLTFIMTAILLWVMVANFKFEAGDVIEKLLIQTRDLNKILQSSKSGKWVRSIVTIGLNNPHNYM